MKDLIEKYSEILKKKFPSQKSIVGNIFYSVTESSSSLQAAILHQAYSDQSICVVLSSNFEAEIFYRELLSYLPESAICYFPGLEMIPYEYAHVPFDIKRARIFGLNNIKNEKKQVYITSVGGFLQTVPPMESIFRDSLELRIGSEYDQSFLLQSLIQLGYERRSYCDVYGTFSVKGSIIDIYLSASRDPVRLDFFGDTLEAIKVYDPVSQKSIGSLDSVQIFPTDEFFLSESEKREYFRILSTTNLQKPEDTLQVVEELIPLVRKNQGFLSHFKEKPLILIPCLKDVSEKANKLKREITSIYNRKKEYTLLVPPESLYSFGEEFYLLTEGESDARIEFTQLPPPSNIDRNIILPTKSAQEFNGKIREARERLELLLSDEKNKVIITSSYVQQAKRLEGLFASYNVERLNPDSEEPAPIPSVLGRKGNFFIVLSELSKGFEIPSEHIFVWTENEIFGRRYRRKTKYKKTSSKAIDSFLDLREGDFVVHINHGIGRFKSIERVVADGKSRDFLKLEYAGNATLYVPLDQISLVQRYIGGSESPKLDTLGKSHWKKTKERVRESIEKLATDLVQIYANRLKLKGYSFPPDTIWQEEFEADFEYEETPDQLAAIEAVKRDLESPKPMDRLVCGDVGYGKTEVALRATFKVLMAGKQVLFMSPTTILTLQHYNTFLERFRNYPIKIGYISRFKTASENKSMMEAFRKGEIDILIGTHALLNKSLKAKNLGLLIIDEEQKFGVEHKEALKTLKQLVDVLTLTATPIPRTLHMALTGIRDLSIIQTPPKNRQSVETYVMEENFEIIEKAIRREVERGGQVFYIYNRVDGIESEAKKIAELLPDLSIGILHGQMEEEMIEEILLLFYRKEYDVLVTTTIIESGIDMPNVNTLIIQRADTFGLSQLYQLRGRVGRSDRQAYAYLFYPAGRLITEQAEKRLNTIYEYQDLGSGFKVAMRDLEIRGAGNILGTEQSGDIMEVGFDLYVKMLEEAISKIRGDEIETDIRTNISLSADFYIPDEYIPDTRQKIEFYKKFESCQTLEELDEVASEMQDRFGEPPPTAKVFLILERIRTLASGLGFESIRELGDEIRLKSGENFKGDPEALVNLLAKIPGLKIHPSDPSTLRYKHGARTEEEKLLKLQNLLVQVPHAKKKKTE